jgi:purine-binding chemotaxis protein CheW
MNEQASQSPAAAAAGIAQYLTFFVGEEEYGVEILRVQEIKGYSEITPIPNAPSFVKGVMNLRGTVVPVLVLREMFGMPRGEYNKFSVIIVLSVGTKIVGVLVDAVSEVVDLGLSDIDMAPELGNQVDTSFIAGMGNSGDRFIIVLDIDKVVAGVDRAGELSADPALVPVWSPEAEATPAESANNSG